MNKSKLGIGIINFVGYCLMFIGANLLFIILRALWGVIIMYRYSNTVVQDANSSFTFGPVNMSLIEVTTKFSLMFIFVFSLIYLGYFLTQKIKFL